MREHVPSGYDSALCFPFISADPRPIFLRHKPKVFTSSCVAIFSAFSARSNPTVIKSKVMAEPIMNGSSHAHELQTLSAATVSKFDGENFAKVPPLDFAFENIKYEVNLPASGRRNYVMFSFLFLEQMIRLAVLPKGASKGQTNSAWVVWRCCCRRIPGHSWFLR